MGQNHHHAAALLHSSATAKQQQQQQQQPLLRLRQPQIAQRQLLPKAQQSTLKLSPSRAADQVLQSFSSSTSSAPCALPAQSCLQPANNNSSSNGAAPVRTRNNSSSSKDPELLLGFQKEIDSGSADCTPAFAGNQA
jgi:hypothetical protein